MNKNRLEALSDGVFSIVMTLLIFNISVPILDGTASDVNLLMALQKLTPVFASYFTSFAVLAMFWISHNFFYHSFTKEINRKLVLLNMLYLALLAFIPFSTRLLGEYDMTHVAIIWYGVNVLAIGFVASTVLHYAIYSNEIDTSHVTPRLLTQARIRSLLTVSSTLIGILCAFFSTPLALFFFALPIVFNLIPGSLDLVEEIFNLSF
jgi:uncharacterized membrane protein